MNIIHYAEDDHKQKFEHKAWGIANYCFGGIVDFPSFFVADAINKKGLLLAIDGDELAGIAGYSKLEGRQELEQLNQIIKFCLEPTLHKEQDTKQVAEEYNVPIEKVEWVPSPNSFSCYSPMNDDIVFTIMAVMPHYRGRGIGKRLMEERINIARQGETSAIFAWCYERGPSIEVHRSFGFEPIFRQKPFYRDGEGCTIMGLKLK